MTEPEVVTPVAVPPPPKPQKVQPVAQEDYRKYYNKPSLNHARCQFFETALLKSYEVKASDVDNKFHGWSISSILDDMMDTWDKFMGV